MNAFPFSNKYLIAPLHSSRSLSAGGRCSGSFHFLSTSPMFTLVASLIYRLHELSFHAECRIGCFKPLPDCHHGVISHCDSHMRCSYTSILSSRSFFWRRRVLGDLRVHEFDALAADQARGFQQRNARFTANIRRRRVTRAFRWMEARLGLFGLQPFHMWRRWAMRWMYRGLPLLPHVADSYCHRYTLMLTVRFSILFESDLLPWNYDTPASLQSLVFSYSPSLGSLHFLTHHFRITRMIRKAGGGGIGYVQMLANGIPRPAGTYPL